MRMKTLFICIMLCLFITAPAHSEKLKMRVPAGCRAAPDAKAESYTKTGWAEEVIHEKTGIEMVFIPAGKFTMGSNGRRSDEKPAHKVRITRSFYMGKYEVTNGQYRRHKASHDSKDYKGSSLNGDRQPVVHVSWKAAKEYCDWSGLALPTEAQWEYACRAGTKTKFYFGDNANQMHKYANYADGSTSFAWSEKSQNDGYKVTAPVGSFKPNAWGLYDMHGNVCEWCTDWHDRSYYGKSPKENPKGPAAGRCRILRGGSWFFRPNLCRSTTRGLFAGVSPSFNGGFRVIRGL